MTKNMSDLLKTIVEDKGAIVNKIIKGKIFTADEIVDYAFETNDKDIIGAVAAHIKGISNDNIEKLTDFIIAAKDPMLATKFAIYNEKAPINLLANFVINSKNPEEILEFAQSVNNAPIAALTEAIIKINNPNYIYFFIRDIDHISPVLLDALINTKDAKRIYDAAFAIKKKYEQDHQFLTVNQITKLEKGIIETNSAEYIYLFAKDITNTSSLENAIIKTENIDFIKVFSLNVKGADKTKLHMAIERIYVLKENKNSQMEILFNAILTGNTDKISAASDIYRELFLDETLDKNLVENTKKRVLTKQPSQGMRTKPQFPREKKLKK